jgi:predicted transcriptional regulator
VTWRDYICALVKAGLTEDQIAHKIGTTRQAVNFAKNTTSPKYDMRHSPGSKLIALYESYVREGFIHDRSTTAQLGAILAGGIPQEGDGKPRGAIPPA